MDENGASISRRNELRALELEALAADNPLLTCAAGTHYTVDTTAHPMRQKLTIRGNGAELRNVNQTPLDVEHNVSSLLALGVSMVWDTPLLTYHPVQSTNGPALSLPAGTGADFAPGDLVVLHGALTYPGPGNEYEVYRNYLRARVVEVIGDTVTIDRAVPSQLLIDSPVIGNTAEGHLTGLPRNPQFYLLYAPHISHVTLASDLGETLRYGGTIDGTFRDLTIDGRSGLTLNAMQDCLFENIRFRAWRIICELAEGSYGTVVRNMRGSLTDASTRFGGAPDAAPFFISLGENCAECVLEDLAVDSGPNDTTGGAGVIFSSGRNNEMRNSRLRFPALSAPALSIQANPAAGHPNVDCGFRQIMVTAPVCSQFFACNDAGGGIVRPYLEGSRFFGAPTLRAATLNGKNGRLCDNFFENGDVYLAGPSTTGWRVEGNTVNGAMTFLGGTNNTVRRNYIRDGFGGLTNDFLKANDVADNESDASRRLNAASVISNVQTNITALEANTTYAAAIFDPGDLGPGDKIFLSTMANVSSAGTTFRFARVSIGPNDSKTGLGSTMVSAPSAPIGFEGVIEVRTDTYLVCNFSIGGKLIHNVATVPSISANGLAVNLEYWVSNSNEHINVRAARIVAAKPGMRHLPIR